MRPGRLLAPQKEAARQHVSDAPPPRRIRPTLSQLGWRCGWLAQQRLRRSIEPGG